MRITLFATWLLLPAIASAGELKAGAASTIITPVVGTPMAGYYYSRASTGVHDDLLAKALVLELDGTKVALVSLDLISTNRPMVLAARAAIAKVTDIPSGNVMISGTHAHTGPVLATNLLRDAFDTGVDLVRRFSDELPGKIAEAVRLADAARVPVRASAGRGREEGIAFNRRFHMRDGSISWNPGAKNPEVIKAAGPVDPDVHVAAFAPPGKKPRAIFINHAVHLDIIGGTQFSADMPAVLSRLLADAIAPDLTTVYTTGCCGDVNHINVAWDAPQKGFDFASRCGTILAAEVLRTLPRMQPFDPAGLRSRSEIVRLPLPAISEADVAKAREVIANRGNGRTSTRQAFLDQVKAFQVLDVMDRKGEPYPVEVQVVALGTDLAWVSLPGEIFTELGLAIKQDSPFPQTIISELANGSVGYIPSRRAYPQGNYEVISSRVAEGSGEQLVAVAVKLLKQLHREAQTGGPAVPSR